jgi:hypothetical protein
MGRWSSLLAEQLIEFGGTAPLTIRMEYRDFADYRDPISNAQAPVGDCVNSLPPNRLDRFGAAVRSAYLAGREDGPRSMAATAWAARGIVP